MGKFSDTRLGRTPPTTPLRTKKSDRPIETFEGGAGYTPKTKSELFVLAATNMVGEDTFYESGQDRDDRFRALARKVSAADPAWVAGFVPYLRNEMQMRSASVVLATEYALAQRPAGAPSVRSVIDSALARADEPAEFIGYWMRRTGRRTLPGGVQRGLADAVVRLYDEYSALKYDGISRAIRMGDVIELTHPKPKAPWQRDLLRWLLDQRHHHDDGVGKEHLEFTTLTRLQRNRALHRIPVAERRDWVTSPDVAEVLHAAGFTWEEIAGWIQGPMTAEVWEAVIPSMGYMALLRNLRNFDEAGVRDEVAETVAAKLADPAQVARSRQFPYRFLSAFLEVSNLRWALALEKAANAALDNVPVFPGKTCVLVDTSGSMVHPLSGRTKVQRTDVGILLGVALARKSEVTLVNYSTGSQVVSIARGVSLLPAVEQFRSMVLGGGTDTWGAVQRHAPGHDRIVVITDEQAHDDLFEGGTGAIRYGVSNSPPTRRRIPDHVNIHTFNVAGYAPQHAPAGRERHFRYAGFTDKAFQMMRLVEAGVDQTWPWLER